MTKILLGCISLTIMSGAKSSDVAVYMPVRNAASWAATVSLPRGVHLIAADSGSTDDTVGILRQRGVRVLDPVTQRGRVENWNFCLSHFAKSDATWMRWLFAGDSLDEGSFTASLSAARQHPDVRMMVGGYHNCLGENACDKVLPVQEATRLTAEAALRRSVLDGNWFGPPLTLWLHRELVASGAYDLGRHEWAADFFAATSAAATGGCLVLPIVQGTFNAIERAFFQKHRNSPQARLESLAVRMEALLRLKANSAIDEEEAGAMWHRLEKEVWAGAFHAHVTEGQDPEFLGELKERFPVRLMTSILPNRLQRWVRMQRA